MRMRNAYLAVGAILLAGLLMTTAATRGNDETAAAANNQGDLWETTSQMSMVGMPMSMPARSMKVCARHGATHPPVANDPQQKCENSAFQRSDSTVTWTTTCKNPAMTGEGKITYEGENAYKGTITFNSEGGAMTIKLTGTKIGTCDKPVD